MPTDKKYSPDFIEQEIFHVYNRTNNRERLFKNDTDRYTFLKEYFTYMHDFLDTYCWSLLPNHFHFIVKIKSLDAITKNLESRPYRKLTACEKKYLTKHLEFSELIEQSFKRFFQTYSLYFNARHERKGNLFHRPFKRVQVEKENHFTQAIVYVHCNAVKHQLASDFTQYPWSSWHQLISNRPTDLLRDELFEWFGNKKLFVKAHKELSEFYYKSDVSIEE